MLQMTQQYACATSVCDYLILAYHAKLLRMFAGRSARGRRGCWRTLYSALGCTTLPKLRKAAQLCSGAPATPLELLEDLQHLLCEAA